ncbi:MAG: prepilin peptidase [Deltaproteobacteria bacterium]|nr:MAG: prepilin peptidase [Deltaproteobacteria bacterium]
MTHAATATLIAAAAAAAWSDLRHRRVSNRLNLAIFALGLGWRVALDPSLSTVALALAGAAVGFALLFPLFAARWTGAGDVKLLAALGAWLGPSAIAYAGLYGVAGGGVLAAAMTLAGGAALRRAVATHVALSVATLTAPHAPRRARRHVVPMAVPFAVAAVAVFVARGGLS